MIIMDRKAMILLMATALIIVSVIFLLIFLINDRQNRNTITPSPTPVQIPTVVPSATPGENELIVVSTLPAENLDTPFLPIQKITLQFNDEIAPEDLIIETSPSTEVDIIRGSNNNQVFIIPSTLWAIGRTDITILQSTSSLSEKRLLRPYNYSIITALPTLSPEELYHSHP